LVAAIAQHSEEEDPISTILEVSALTVSALNVPLSASFFSGALVAFVEKNEIQKAIHLIRVMQERHDIDMLDELTAMAIVEALQALREAVFKDRNRHLDGSTACMLLTMVSGPLIQSANYSNVEPLRQYLEDAIESLMISNREDDDDDEYDTDSGDEDDEDYDEYDTDDFEEDERRAGELMQDIVDRGCKVVFEEMNEREELESLPPFPKFPLDDETDDMTKEMVYLRTSKANTWMLPDVTDQLVQLNRGEDVFYTREYEEEIVEEMVDSQVGHY
jgi:hypothetical protein